MTATELVVRPNRVLMIEGEIEDPLHIRRLRIPLARFSSGSITNSSELAETEVLSRCDSLTSLPLITRLRPLFESHDRSYRSSYAASHTEGVNGEDVARGNPRRGVDRLLKPPADALMSSAFCVEAAEKYNRICQIGTHACNIAPSAQPARPSHKPLIRYR